MEILFVMCVDHCHIVMERLNILLAAVLIIAFAGALLTNLGWDLGIIALIIGISACIPIISELYRTGKRKSRLFNNIA